MVYNTTTNMYGYSKWVVDNVGFSPYTTVQSAINACNTAGGGTVVVRPGTYVENLTLYDKVSLEGTGNADEIIIRGTHTPPVAGDISFKNLTLTSATHVISSAAAGTTSISFTNVFSVSTNGYLLNIVNWTGLVYLENYASNGTDDGFINNTAGCPITSFNSVLGAGSANTMHASGVCFLVDTIISCPSSFELNCSFTIRNGLFTKTLTTVNNATGSIVNTYFSTGAFASIAHGSTGTVDFGNVTINSSNNPVISGAGAGALQIGSITYLDGKNLAVTLTLDYTTRLETGELKLDTLNGYLFATNGVVSTAGGGVSQLQIYYVGKHGNDANNGLSIETAKLTFGSAITAAAALTPSAVNRFVIVCFDEGIYTENITCGAYIDIHAPNATLTGILTCSDNSDVKLHAINVATATIGVVKTAGTIYSNIDIDIVTCAGSGIGFLTTVGVMNCRWKELYIVDGFGVGDLSSLVTHLHVYGGDIYISGTGTGIARANAGSIVGHIDHILDTGIGATTAIAVFNGTIDVIVNKIDCDTAYTVSGATSVLRLFCNEITGVRTVALGGTARVWIPPLYGSSGQILQSSGEGVDPVYTTATYPATTAQGDLLLSATANTITPLNKNATATRYLANTGAGNNAAWDQINLANGVTGTLLPVNGGTGLSSPAAHSLIVTEGAAAYTALGVATNGQLVIGSTGADPVLAVLTAGAGIGITNAAGSITIASTATGGMPWTETTVNAGMVVNNGYVANKGGLLTMTLPATAVIGNILAITGINTAVGWRIAQNANQRIHMGNLSSTIGVGGYIEATAIRDSAELVCVVAGASTEWNVISSMGNITVV